MVALVRPRHQPGGGQFTHDAPDPGGSQVVDGAGQRPRDPQNVPAWAGDDLEIHPVPTVLAGVERPMRILVDRVIYQGLGYVIKPTRRS